MTTPVKPGPQAGIPVCGLLLKAGRNDRGINFDLDAEAAYSSKRLRASFVSRAFCMPPRAAMAFFTARRSSSEMVVAFVAPGAAATFHRQHAYCCGSGCRQYAHEPWYVAGNKRVHP